MLICKILSLEKNNEYSNIKRITLPSVKGFVEILSGYAESFIILKEGTIELYDNSNSKKEYPIKNGAGYIKDNVLTILVNSKGKDVEFYTKK
ncbi:hypothetical protein COV24_01560 [candidate division WWE3 bacterium CG10_big_fil_rev_8_21_14_0_10_32_10]|uniref:ATP synthase F1 complex delta/epsilon subunit N-terminal domain-containing protein n=1 Tax=candidate division WWE3 bacterium CG10_big_fil_rev_8_21_14_0_10_32_10 TaxID=1975090 RepID=A0A2H0RB10_UNCKA|nr:MAG: hypothetical protein COV24_01560 [candidate division WWE3 bacterium CG10_big_fil_rev_8_21_14_0_10_32_10]